MMGDGAKAVELYKMINPIEHSKNIELANIYKVEPYIIPADVYGVGNLAGQGGWTWYTGSASWYYICLVKYILGIHVNNRALTINPQIPCFWNNFSVSIELFEKKFLINVINNNSVNDENGAIKLKNNEERTIKIDSCSEFNEINIYL